jgi:hypothetical protein
MALSNHRLRRAIDPAYDAECRARPQPSAESGRQLAEAMKESTRRLEREFAKELKQAEILSKAPRRSFIWWPVIT